MLPKYAIKVVRIMFNASFVSGQVPQNWKNGRIDPLHKQGKDLSEVASYRPMCLTSTLGRWMERVLNNRLVYELESKRVIM